MEVAESLFKDFSPPRICWEVTHVPLFQRSSETNALLTPSAGSARSQSLRICYTLLQQAHFWCLGTRRG